MSALLYQTQDVEAPEFPGASFGRSAEGLIVALVGETAFAMLPGRDGKFFLATGWNLRRPMQEWTRSDFFGHGGELADEAAFRMRVDENAEHQREKRALDRREMHSTANTPWGRSQGATVYAEGVVCHSTAGHGGIHLSGVRNRKVHDMLRAAGGWYEEDAAWAIVAITYPHLFTSFERRCAERTLKDSWPDGWENIFGTVLQPGESRSKDERAFLKEHAADWIVRSAIYSDHRTGFTEVVATLGGRHSPGTEERRFLIPSDEYQVGRFGFVVDPERHAVYSGPSSFIGWRGRVAS
ncbi:hypothetical protein C5748_09685 [Phyllobacterium phragmitis]|uniref:DUF7007 domain-containing protein n=1 Tax=Phyllobacterium phragmitis TaxID=2670329 RepID=A0A2S9ISM9_9HYPH|nr:hypothetical protein [Phyllobacterium phragmitis]PRD43534.1 hypothetical protein C5748_09685 [Phyllobacterium phragmitis]